MQYIFKKNAIETRKDMCYNMLVGDGKAIIIRQGKTARCALFRVPFGAGGRAHSRRCAAPALHFIRESGRVL